MSRKIENNTSNKFCLNCQTELHGSYCHKCGQKATPKDMTVKEFILEYLNIAFIWDIHFFKTMGHLLRRPGHLTNEYVSGKFVSYMHPLKLNMFLLFVFITFLLLFHSAEDMSNSVQSLTRNEALYPMIQLDYLSDKQEYLNEIKSSKTDTVQLYAPLRLSESFPEIIGNVDGNVNNASDSMAIWTASVPDCLIKDEYIILHADGYYYFNQEKKSNSIDTGILENVWKQMVELTTDYFLIIILMTAPLLSFVVSLLHRKREKSRFKHFIFSLHYTAFLETLIIFLYILHLISSPSTWIMQWILIAASFIYLAIAVKKVYNTKNWLGAILHSVITNFGYSLILLAIFFSIFMISITIVALQM